MFPRLIAATIFLTATCTVEAQEAMLDRLPQRAATPEEKDVESAWLDLRQTPAANAKAQSAPSWVEAVTLATPEVKPGEIATSIFRIRLSRPRPDFQVLMFRLFFDDKPDQRPTLVAWDESGTEVLRSAPL